MVTFSILDHHLLDGHHFLLDGCHFLFCEIPFIVVMNVPSSELNRI